MRTRKFNALNDILFKFVFGHRENKDITLSFINAVLGLEGERALVDLQFADREVDPDEESGKGSTLDLLCMTNDETQINIEVQVQKRQNMGQRSLYYWAKLYHSTLRRGEDYAHLRRTISINLLGYTYLYCTQGCGHTERRDGVKPWQNTVPMKMVSGNVNPFSWTDPDAGNFHCV